MPEGASGEYLRQEVLYSSRSVCLSVCVSVRQCYSKFMNFEEDTDFGGRNNRIFFSDDHAIRCFLRVFEIITINALHLFLQVFLYCHGEQSCSFYNVIL